MTERKHYGHGTAAGHKGRQFKQQGLSRDTQTAIGARNQYSMGNACKAKETAGQRLDPRHSALDQPCCWNDGDRNAFPTPTLHSAIGCSSDMRKPEPLEIEFAIMLATVVTALGYLIVEALEVLSWIAK